jgi:hypothetical protein
MVQTLSPNSRTLTNSSSVKARSLALSICIFYLFKTSMSFIYFLKACISSFLCFSSLRLSSTSLSMSRLWPSFLPYSVTRASLSYSLTFSSSSIALFSLASLEETSWFCFLFSRSTRSISLFYSFSCDSNPCTFYCSSIF